MPRAVKKRDRLRQIHNWLSEKYPTPFPTDLRCIKCKGDNGYASRVGRRLRITLNISTPLYHLIDTLLHEYSHCVTWKHSSMERHTDMHSDEWGLQLAKMYRDFYDQGGDMESREYGW